MRHFYSRNSLTLPEANQGRWFVAVSPTTRYGYFTDGGEVEGGLWFAVEGAALVLRDFDGRCELPREVARQLVALRVVVPSEFVH